MYEESLLMYLYIIVVEKNERNIIFIWHNVLEKHKMIVINNKIKEKSAPAGTAGISFLSSFIESL